MNGAVRKWGTVAVLVVAFFAAHKPLHWAAYGPPTSASTCPKYQACPWHDSEARRLLRIVAWPLHLPFRGQENWLNGH